MAWQIFATKTSPNPMSTLDTQSSNLSAMGTVACSASGTNVITLTPSLSGYTGPAYANFVDYSFAAANSNSGATTLKVGALAALNCYRADGTTQITTGDIISGQCYMATYNSALNSAAGGWYITNIGQGASSLPDPVTTSHGGTGLTSPGTSGNVLVSNGTIWTSAAPASSSMVYLATLTASSSAALADTTHFTSTYAVYKIDIINLIPATDATVLRLRTSINAGGAYATATYRSNIIGTDAATGTTIASDQATAYIACSGITNMSPIKNTAALGLSGTIFMYGPADGTHRTYFSGFLNWYDGSGAGNAIGIMGGMQDSANTAVNAIQFTMSSGNIASGVIKIYGQVTA